jgi:anti-sigma factor RsiW
MTRRPSEDELMALADGELDAAREAEVRAEIARDPDLALRFAEHAETRALLDATPAPAVPAALTAAVLRAAAATGPGARPALSAVAGGRVDAPVPVGGTPKPVPARPARGLAAIAATVALIAGGLAGYLARPAPDPAAAFAGLPAGIVAVLETAPSGATRTVDLGAGRAATMGLVSTHPFGANGACREYALSEPGAATPRELVVACREGAGPWRARLVLSTGGEGGFGTATGPQEVIDRFLDGIGAAERVGGEAERRLLERR